MMIESTVKLIQGIILNWMELDVDKKIKRVEIK